MRISETGTARQRLRLPQVTLCAVTSVNVAATTAALERCLEQVQFGACKLLTDFRGVIPAQGIQHVLIDPIRSADAYSHFILTRLADHVETDFCLLVQWDGYILDAARWQPNFLDFDYIGASWPQFSDGHDVGNGGFSLRSRRLLRACQQPGFRVAHPEDVAIGRLNRAWLEEQGMRFAPRDLADAFAAERSGDLSTSFGFHGAFNMPKGIGVDAFWRIYRQLDDRSTIRHDFWSIARAVAAHAHGVKRGLILLYDRLCAILRSKRDS